MQCSYVFELAVVTDLQLKAAKPTFHEAVLPRATSLAGTECYFHLGAQILVFVTQIFAPLVTVQDGWWLMFAQSIQYGSVC